MKPVTVAVTVPQRREEVFDFLNVLGNHESFTDHFLLDWEVSGPRAGVGARARMRVKGPGREDWIEMEVVAADPPRMTAEESIGARGRRRTRGTYRLDEVPAGGTMVNFEFAWLEAPPVERLAALLTRAVVRRANAKSLRRLAAGASDLHRPLAARPGGETRLRNLRHVDKDRLDPRSYRAGGRELRDPAVGYRREERGLACGIFTSPRLADLNAIGDPGLWYSGSLHQLGAQALGVATAFGCVFVVSYATFWAIKATIGLRVTEEATA